MTELEHFAKSLLQVTPRPSGFRVGDKVTFTNDQGVSFTDLEVIGFSGDKLNDRFVHLNTDCYWMPKRPDQLAHSDGCPSECANCNFPLNDAERFNHRQEVKSYNVPMNETMCLCKGCESERNRMAAIAEEADEDAPYIEY